MSMASNTSGVDCIMLTTAHGIASCENMYPHQNVSLLIETNLKKKKREWNNIERIEYIQ